MATTAFSDRHPCFRGRAHRGPWLAGVGVLIAGLALSCGPTQQQVHRDGGGGGTDANGSDGGAVGDGALHQEAEVCDETEFAIQALPPNLLILLDRSGSMANDVPGTPGNRWDVATQAVRQVTSQFETVIRFGLATYSACLPGGCSAGTIVVPIADQNAGAIQSFLDGTVGEGSADGQQVNTAGKIQYLCDSGDPETSTGASLQAQVGEPSLAATDRENVILLITDGEETSSCIQGGVNGSVAAGNLLAQSPSVRTYAVGFMGANVSELQAIATAGGTSQPYFADQAAQLQQALEDIAANVARCEFGLPGLAPTADPNKVNFYFDGVLVGYDQDCAQGVGWTWTDGSHTRVRFCDQACGQITGNQVQNVSATFGCLTTPVL